MAGNDDAFSSPLFVPQGSPELGVNGDNNNPQTLFEEFDLGMPLELPDVDMDHVDDLKDFVSPKSKPMMASRSRFRLPEAGNTTLVDTQLFKPQEHGEEQDEDVEMRASPNVGRDVSFTSPSSISPLTAFDFNLDADVSSFDETRVNSVHSNLELPSQDLSVAQPQVQEGSLLVAEPQVTHEGESEAFPSFLTDVGQLEFTFGQPDPYTDFASGVNQPHFTFDQQERVEDSEPMQEATLDPQTPIGLPSLQPHPDNQPAPASIIKREPASSISPFISRAERARRAQAKLNATDVEMTNQEPQHTSNMASIPTARARTRAGALNENTNNEKPTFSSSEEFTQAARACAHPGTPIENTDNKKKSTLLSSAAFTEAARARERSGTPYGIKPNDKLATTTRLEATLVTSEILTGNAADSLNKTTDSATLPAAANLNRAQRRKNERNQKRDDKRSSRITNSNPYIANAVDQGTTILADQTGPLSPMSSSPDKLIATAYDHLSKQAAKYRELENDACDREEYLAEMWSKARELRVQAIEERRNALVVIRHRRRHVKALEGLSRQAIVDGGLARMLRPLHVSDEPRADSEEFEKMEEEGKESRGQEDDGYETPPYGDA